MNENLKLFVKGELMNLIEINRMYLREWEMAFIFVMALINISTVSSLMYNLVLGNKFLKFRVRRIEISRIILIVVLVFWNTYFLYYEQYRVSEYGISFITVFAVLILGIGIFGIRSLLLYHLTEDGIFTGARIIPYCDMEGYTWVKDPNKNDSYRLEFMLESWRYNPKLNTNQIYIVAYSVKNYEMKKIETFLSKKLERIKYKDSI